MHTVVLQGLLSVFVSGSPMSAVEPSIAARRSVVLCSSPKGESRSHAVPSCSAPPLKGSLGRTPFRRALLLP